MSGVFESDGSLKQCRFGTSTSSAAKEGCMRPHLEKRIESLEAELRTLRASFAAAETLCKVYFDIAIESGWSERVLRAERDKRIAALDAAAKEKT